MGRNRFIWSILARQWSKQLYPLTVMGKSWSEDRGKQADFRRSSLQVFKVADIPIRHPCEIQRSLHARPFLHALQPARMAKFETF